MVAYPKQKHAVSANLPCPINSERAPNPLSAVWFFLSPSLLFLLFLILFLSLSLSLSRSPSRSRFFSLSLSVYLSLCFSLFLYFFLALSLSLCIWCCSCWFASPLGRLLCLAACMWYSELTIDEEALGQDITRLHIIITIILWGFGSGTGPLHAALQCSMLIFSHPPCERLSWLHAYTASLQVHA